MGAVLRRGLTADVHRSRSAATEWGYEGKPKIDARRGQSHPGASVGLILNAARRVGGTFVLRPATGDSTRHIRSGGARRVTAS
jgi:hypothetical protein